MKVLLDTNIIIDIALERQPYLTNSETVLAFVEQKQIEGYISASTIRYSTAVVNQLIRWDYYP